MLRIAGSSSDLNRLLTAAGFVSALGFAVLLVLAARFPFWVVDRRGRWKRYLEKRKRGPWSTAISA